jgi:hypothetical protein
VKRLYWWLGFTGLVVLGAIAVDGLTSWRFSLLSVLADVVTVLGIVALAVEFGIYVTERRPQARAREAVINLADSNPGKWAPAHEELIEIGEPAIQAVSPLACLRFRPGQEGAETASRRAVQVLWAIADQVGNPSTAVAATRVLGEATKLHEFAIGRLQTLLYDAAKLPPQVGAQAAVELANSPRSKAEHIGNAFKYERGKLTGVFALVGLAMISERVDVGPEIQKALKYDDQDVQRIARLLQDETEQTWTPTTLLDAVQSDRVDVSKQAIAAVRLMVDAAKEQS